MITGVMRRHHSFVTLLALALLPIGAQACGGGRSHRAATSPSPGAPPAKSSTPGESPASQGRGRVRATLRGANHDPVARANWIYTVRVTDSAGKPLSGTVLSQFVFSGQVVGRENPPSHQLRNGLLHDVMQFPAQAVGIPLSFETVVRTRLGSVTLDWPVMARR